MQTLSQVRKILFLCVSGLLLGVCSAYPDPSIPGTCSLSCGNPKIAAGNANIRFLGTNAIKLACHGVTPGDPYPSTVPIHFVIEQPSSGPGLPTVDIGGGASTDTSTSTSSGAVPVPGVSFEPTIIAGLTGPDNNPDDSAAKYKGIVTSQSEWCTDSCGVGYIEVIPLCFSDDNEVRVQIHSGSAAAVTTLSVSP